MTDNMYFVWIILARQWTKQAHESIDFFSVFDLREALEHSIIGFTPLTYWIYLQKTFIGHSWKEA